MRTGPIAIAAVVVIFLAMGGYLVFGRAGGGGAARTVDVSVTGSTMAPGRISARQGDRLTLNVTTDRKEEIHLHGYDVKFEVEAAGKPVSHTFTADKTGTFDIEIEDTGTEIGSLEVTP